VSQLYDFDSKLPIMIAPKLTQKHVKLPPFSNLRVKYATNVLSHSVAAHITTMAHLGSLPKEAVHSEQFVEKMDRLFNCFKNSHFTNSKKMKYAMSEKYDYKRRFLKICYPG